MNHELLSFLHNLKLDRRIKNFDEASTKQAIIVKLLSILNWDIFNIEEVKPEYSVGNKRVDYALRQNSVDKVFIEVKKIAENLEKHQEQLLNYSFQQGVKLAILTNGIIWWFYLPLHEGSWEQRKFYTIDIKQQNPEDIATKFWDYLQKKNVLSGSAVKNAEAIYKGRQKIKILKETLPKAWNQLVSEVNDTLIEMITERTESLCGLNPDSELVESFLLSNHEQLTIQNVSYSSRVKPKKVPIVQPVSKTKRGRKPNPNKISYSGKTIDSITLIDKNYEIEAWRHILILICEYIIKHHQHELTKLFEIKGKKRPYFTYNKDELRTPSKIKGSKIYTEVNLSSNSVVKLSYQVLETFGYDSSDLQIKVKEG